MTAFIDSHAHLADPAFDDDRDAVIERARAAGAPRDRLHWRVDRGGASARAAIAAAHPGFVFATAGVHPHDAADFDPSRDVAAIRELVARGAVAIGECGLDYHYDHSPRELQRARVRRAARAGPRARSRRSSSTRARPRRTPRPW